MKATIDVTDRAEGDRIRAALTDATTRAFVNVIGALQPLEERARERVLRFVTDTFADEQREQEGHPS